MPELQSTRSRWFPWRSAALGWLVAGVFLFVGVPLFLRMPLWCDATLHAVAANAIATDGVHYRDVFETNPPGFAWALWCVRGVFGLSAETIRATDLAIVALVTLGLVWLARGSGSDRANVAWMCAAIAAFYLFIHEFNHVQRDVWMMLPAVVAIMLRLKRAEGRNSLLLAFAEGLIWGVGCWIKPHMLFIAAAAWLVTLRRLRVADHVAVFAGGVVAGLLGLAWLISTGAWPYFVNIWTTWNADYFALVRRELPFRAILQLQYFPPYSALALLAVPLALANLRSQSEAPHILPRKMLAAVYLAWLFTALLLQRPFHYVHVPETLLMFALFAANRWAVPFALVLLQVVAGVLMLCTSQSIPFVNPHPAFDVTRTRWWSQCLEREPSREASQGVARWSRHFGGVDPVELGAVADYLRAQNVRDGELITWHDSPHALYLDLNVKPGFRFMHVANAAGLGKWQEQEVLRELKLAVPHAKFVVSDMNRITEKYDQLNEVDVDGLPKVLPAWQRKEFPWDQPVVFRSPGGRYLVHRIEKPVTSCRIPEKLDQQEPDKD